MDAFAGTYAAYPAALAAMVIRAEDRLLVALSGDAERRSYRDEMLLEYRRTVTPLLAVVAGSGIEVGAAAGYLSDQAEQETDILVANVNARILQARSAAREHFSAFTTLLEKRQRLARLRGSSGSNVERRGDGTVKP
jgi:hypothetical protein